MKRRWSLLFVTLFLISNQCLNSPSAAGGFGPGAQAGLNRGVLRVEGEDNTPLMDAALYDYFDKARSLIAQGADVNAEDKNGWTALMFARNADMARLLVAHGAGVNHKDRYHQTAIMVAAASYYGDDVIPIFVSHGAHVNEQDSEGDTALTLAAGSFLLTSVRVLVAHGARINHRNHVGRTPLMCASLSLQEWGENSSMEPYQDKAPDTVEYLVTHGANIDARDNDGMTALMWASHVVEYFNDQASESTACRILSRLLAHHANVNAVDYDGNTPLIWASRVHPYGDPDEEDLSIRYAKLLLAHGANPRIRNRYDATAIDIARANGFNKLAALFRADMRHKSIRCLTQDWKKV